MKKYCISILLLVVVQAIAWAHNPNEVSYFFKLDQGELVIHLTPKTAADILLKVNPTMAGTKVINFSAYLPDFESYFTKGILVLANGLPVTLKLTKAELTQHEATIHFELEHLPKEIDRYHISATSLVDIYQNGKNYLFISKGDKRHRHVLNQKETQIDGNFEKSNVSPPSKVMGISILYLIAVLFTVGYVVRRKIKIRLNHFHKSGS